MRRFTNIAPAVILACTAAFSVVAIPELVRSASYARTQAQIVLARQTIAQDDILERIDRAVRAVATSVEPSVVHIDILGGRESDSPGRSSGSGWVWDAQGHIITNAHVVRDAERISVQFADGRAESGEIVAVDLFTDIAVLRIDPGPGVTPAKRATSQRPETGDRVFAFGSPFGFKFSMSSGIVSGIGRDARSDGRFGGYSNFIQTDAAVNPGNSGGPLVNVRGEVIGMNVAIATARDSSGTTSDGQSAGISFAIPLPVIDSVVDQLISSRRVSRGFLGISFGQPRMFAPAREGVSGVRVSRVVDDGPAAAAGIRVGDLITHINEQPVPNSAVLRSFISITRPGATATIRLLRDGESREVRATLAQMPAEQAFVQVWPALAGEIGMIAKSEDGGLTISEVYPGSPAERAGLKPGQRILDVGGDRPTNFEDFYRLLVLGGLLENDPVTVRVLPADGDRSDPRSLQLRMRY